jgi:hypothetical protein
MRLVLSGVLAVLLMGSATALAGDSPAGGGIIRVSVSSAGEQANSRSSTASQTSAIILRSEWCVMASTPGHIYGMVKARWGNKDL